MAAEEKYYSLLTLVGSRKIAAAQARGESLNLEEMAVGDGGGAYYAPAEDAVSLRREIYRGKLNALGPDPENPAYIVCEMAIPADAGGFYVREAGIYDAEGDLIAVGSLPVTYKPSLEAGAAKDLYIRFVTEVGNARNVTLKVDPSVVLATRESARQFAAEEVRAHEAKSDPHPLLATRESAREFAAEEVRAHEAKADPHPSYLLEAAYTAEDILNKIKSVPSSGLNADTLGGESLAQLKSQINSRQPAGDYALNAALTSGLASKAAAAHGHALTADGISGVLPAAKGGTGRADGSVSRADTASNSEKTGGYRVAVVTALPPNPDPGTIYFVK